MNLLHLKARPRRGDVLAVIEVPKGAKAKYEYDFELGVVKLSRMSFTSFASPANYGFVPRTWCEDSSPLDILVLCQEALFPGAVVEARILGMLALRAQHAPDPKLLGAAAGDPQQEHLTDLEDVPRHLLKEIAHFFAHYRELEGRKIEVGGWLSREEALRELEDARRRYAERFPEKSV
jgi:inorganic pyrophosphatase